MAAQDFIKSVDEVVKKSLAKVTKVAEPLSDAEELEISRREIEDRAAAMGYMARCMTLATIPHSRLPDDTIVYERRNGDYTLSLRADPKYGLPFGVIPRLLMSWVSVEAVRTQSPQLSLGDTLTDFMAKLGFKPTGGAKGTIQLVKNQVKRLFTTSFSCTYENPGRGRTIHQSFIASRFSDWWIPKNPNQLNLWESYIVLTQEFFQEIINRPVPISLESLANLRRSPLALDIYFWLTHRNFGHPSIGHIGIESLQSQFGASYPLTYQGRRNFKKKFLQALKKVSETYSEAGNLHFDGDILVVPPGRPDVAHSPAHKGIKAPTVQQPRTRPVSAEPAADVLAPAETAAPADVQNAEACWDMKLIIARHNEQPGVFRMPDAFPCPQLGEATSDPKCLVCKHNPNISNYSGPPM